MKTFILSVKLILVPFLVSSPISLWAQQGDHHDHDHGKFDASDITVEQEQRINRLFSMVICNCPKENWTLSLNGCPNSCADHQKNEVLAMVKQGKSDEEILNQQIEWHGPKAVGRIKAKGMSGLLVYGGPFVLLMGALIGVVLFLKSVTNKVLESPKSSPESSSADSTSSDQALTDEDRQLGDAIERELEEMD